MTMEPVHTRVIQPTSGHVDHSQHSPAIVHLDLDEIAEVVGAPVATIHLGIHSDPSEFGGIDAVCIDLDAADIDNLIAELSVVRYHIKQAQRHARMARDWSLEPNGYAGYRSWPDPVGRARGD